MSGNKIPGQDVDGVPLKQGDFVLVTRKAKSHKNGWENSWTPEMDACVGKTLKISSLVNKIAGITLERSGKLFDYEFPSFVLKKVSDPALRREYAPGDKVTLVGAPRALKDGMKCDLPVGGVYTIFRRGKHDIGFGYRYWIWEDFWRRCVDPDLLQPAQAVTKAKPAAPEVKTVEDDAIKPGTSVAVVFSNGASLKRLYDAVLSKTKWQGILESSADIALWAVPSLLPLVVYFHKDGSTSWDNSTATKHSIGSQFTVVPSDWVTEETVKLLPGYTPNQPKTVKITAAWLKEQDACAVGYRWFIETFGKEAEVDCGTVFGLLLAEHNSWADWLRGRLSAQGVELQLALDNN